TAHIYFVAFVFYSLSFAQSGRDSLNFSQQDFNDRLITNNFNKQLNTYNFNTVIKHFFNSDKFFFGISENFNSVITKSTAKNVRDEQYLWAIAQYNLSEKLKLGLMLNNNIFTDDRQLAINKASVLTTSLYAKFFPAENIEISPSGGFSQNSQIGEKDNGFIYGVEGNIDKYNAGDFDLSSSMKFQNEDISPRKNTLRFISFDANNFFEESFNNTISAYYSQQRKDFYFIAEPITASEFNITNNIQSRTESNYFIQDRVRFAPEYSSFSFDLQGKISWRGIDRSTRYISITNIANTNYDTRIEEFRIDLASTADYTADNFKFSLRFSYSERDEKHQQKKYEGISSILLDEREKIEQQKNNTSQLANISIQSKINFSRNDRLTLSLFQRKLKYDTPSAFNFDDRDELLSVARILFEKEFNPFFRIFINLEGNLNRLVYIFSERSSNNNVQRILKFSSGGIFTAGNFSSSNSAEVSANYTVFDYEELNPNFRSYSFRQLALRDSSNFRLNKTLRLFFNGYLKLSEQGDFKWSNFTNKPVRYLSEQYAAPKIFYDYLGFSFGLGLRYFSLTTFSINNGVEKVKVSEYTSIGPLSELSYIVNDRINLNFYGWYEFIRAEDNSKREMANFSIKVSYRF
ncbi:MAG: hypothetical protein AB1298_10355, partial [Bacteroidota bacterium]